MVYENGIIKKIPGIESEVKTNDLSSSAISRLLLASRTAGIGLWEYNFRYNKFTADEVVYSLYNIKQEEYDGTFETWISFIHPDDKERIIESFKKTINELIELEVDFRIIWRDGSIHYIKCTAVIQKDDSCSYLVGTSQDVTQRKIAELSLKESEEKYRSFFENSLDGILLTDPNGDIIAANPAACRILEMTEDELRIAGRSGIVDFTDPRSQLLLEERRKTGSAKGEVTFIRKYGIKFPVEVTSAIFKDAYGNERTSTIFRDISEQIKARQENLATSNALHFKVNELNKIMESSLDVICTIDESGSFVKVSRGAESMWGYSCTVLKGRSFLELVSNEDVDNTQNMFRNVQSGNPVTIFQNKFKHSNGNLIPLLWSAKWDDSDKLMYCIVKDATEKNSLEEAFRSERQRFYELFKFAPCGLGVFRGPGHVFESANDIYLETSGRKDIIGKTVREVFPEIENQGLFELLDHVYKTGEPFIAKERLIQVNKHGKQEDVYLDFIYQAYRNRENDIEGIFFFAINVTEQIQARQKIEQSEKQFRQIVETAQEGIWMSDENDITTFVNQKMCEMLEYSAEEIIGKPVYSFKDEEGVKDSLKRLNRKEKRLKETHESKHITKSGKELWTIVSTNPVFNERGEYKGGLGMFTDITHLKEQELQLKKNAEERELLIAELTKSIKDLKQFSFITSHNFRAPLSNLIGLLNLVDYSTLTDGNKEIVEMFKASTQQLNKTINHLVQILIIKDNVNVSISKIHLPALIEGVSTSFSLDLEELDLKLNIDLEEEYVSFNKAYLESILINLVSNAIKFRSPNRSLKINISTRLKENGDVLMLVEDNGVGIDLKMHRKSIFGLYQRFHSNSNSTGLGLFIVKSQVEVLGGTIDVESEVDKGTTFMLTFKDKVNNKTSDKKDILLTS